MDVKLSEPATTERLRALLNRARAQLTRAQAKEMQLWETGNPFDRSLLKAIHAARDDGNKLREVAATSARGSVRPSLAPSDRFADLPQLLVLGAQRPAVASALAWNWFGLAYPELTSHLVQTIRVDARFPSLSRRLDPDDPGFVTARARMPDLVTWFADRQLDDLCTWIEEVPAPFGPEDAATLASEQSAIESARASAPRVPSSDLVAFARLAATFLVTLSARSIDPLGFPLARDVQLDTNPTLQDRLAIAAWARRGGRRISPRGSLVVLTIPVIAPWPLRLQLIAADIGHGQCGGTGLMLRLDAGAVIGSRYVSIMLCFADEPVDERGQRFERWLQAAYPQAVEAWRPWC